MHDAAFSMKLGSKFVVDATETYGRKAIDNHRSIHRTFKDTNDYTNSEIPTLGTILPKLGLNIEIVKQNLNNSGATVKNKCKIILYTIKELLNNQEFFFVNPYSYFYISYLNFIEISFISPFEFFLILNCLISLQSLSI